MKKILLSLSLVTTVMIGQVPFMVKDINPGPAASGGSYLMPVSNGVAFFAQGSLWYSDGTTAGTNSVKTMTSIASYFKIGPKLYVWATDGISGDEIWETDGTLSGTTLVKDLTPGSAGTSLNIMFQTSTGKVYFTSTQPATGTELYVTDGTAAGTNFVKDINPGTASPNIYKIIDAGNGKIYFLADDGTSGSELWFSDGTNAGTYLVKDVRPGVNTSNISFLKVVNNQLFFMANDGTVGAEMWRSNATTGGTYLLNDFTPGISSTSVFYYGEHNNKLFFETNTSFTPGTAKLWESDGTTGGTLQNANLLGSSGSFYSNFYEFNSSLYFLAYKNYSSWDSLWLFKITNNVSNISLVKGTTYNAASGPTFSVTIKQTNNNKFLFHQHEVNPILNAIIGISDGTNGGTVISAEVAPNFMLEDAQTVPFVGNKWITFMPTPINPWSVEPYAIDGNTGVNSLLKTVNPAYDCYPIGGTTLWFFMRALYCNKLYFVADDGNAGYEFWETDGTTAGTKLLMDIWPGSNSGVTNGFDDSGPMPIISANKMFFYANNNVNGSELWALTTCSALAVSETKLTNTEINIYPNPVLGTLNIKSNSKNNSLIEIINYLGQTVLKQNYSETIDVSKLESGYYILKISGEKNYYSKFIKE